MKLTPKQTELLNRRGVNGTCIRGVWHWTADGEPCGRTLRPLLDKGLMSASYYRDGQASAWITEAGKSALADCR